MNYMTRKYIVPLINRYSHLTFVQYMKRRRKKKVKAQEEGIIDMILKDAEKVFIELHKRPFVCIADFGDDIVVNPINDNTLRYENFCRYNNIPYERVPLNKSNWFSEVIRFDVLVWALSSEPYALDEARTKLYYIENFTHVLCYPSFRNAYSYENKVAQYYLFRHFNLPIVPTFVSHNKAEAEDYIRRCRYPLVSKISTGSGSRGVDIVRTRRSAQCIVSQVFSSGRRTYHSYVKQKGYIYFQDYVCDSPYDLRVIVVGMRAFGYYRMKPKHDFRASGAGLVVKKAIPVEAVRLAFKCQQALGTELLAVDMIKSESSGTYQIIEASIFCGIETSEQLHVDGKPGYYLFDGESITFVEGKFWVQELMMLEVLAKWDSIHSVD